MMREYRFQPGALSSVEPTATSAGLVFQGRGVTFDSWSKPIGGQFYERILPGSVDHTADILILGHHKDDWVLGRTGAGTAKLTAHRDGVYFEVNAAHTERNRDLYESVRRGDIRGASFGFNVPDGGDNWEERNGTYYRTISKLNLYEISIVTFPAYPQSYTQPKRHSSNESLKLVFDFLALS